MIFVGNEPEGESHKGTTRHGQGMTPVGNEPKGDSVKKNTAS